MRTSGDLAKDCHMLMTSTPDTISPFYHASSMPPPIHYRIYLPKLPPFMWQSEEVGEGRLWLMFQTLQKHDDSAPTTQLSDKSPPTGARHMQTVGLTQGRNQRLQSCFKCRFKHSPFHRCLCYHNGIKCQEFRSISPTTGTWLRRVRHFRLLP